MLKLDRAYFISDNIDNIDTMDRIIVIREITNKDYIYDSFYKYMQHLDKTGCKIPIIEMNRYVSTDTEVEEYVLAKYLLRRK